MASLLHRLGALRAVPKSAIKTPAPAPRPVPWDALPSPGIEVAGRVVRFINCIVFTPDGRFVNEDLWVRDGRIIDPVRDGSLCCVFAKGDASCGLISAPSTPPSPSPFLSPFPRP